MPLRCRTTTASSRARAISSSCSCGARIPARLCHAERWQYKGAAGRPAQRQAADSSCCWSRGRPCCQAMLNACGDTPWLLVARSGLVSEVRSGLVSAVRRHRVGRLSFPAGSSMLSWGPPAPSQRAGAGGRGRATRVWPTPNLASAQAPGRRGGPAGPARGAHRPGRPADL
jgi:hypothetical protein